MRTQSRAAAPLLHFMESLSQAIFRAAAIIAEVLQRIAEYSVAR